MELKTVASQIEPTDLGAGSPGPVGNFSPAAEAGTLVLTSGQIPLDPETGKIMGEATLEEQALQVLRNLEKVVEAAGAERRDISSVTVYLADIGDWAAFNQVFGSFFEAPYPARTVVGAGLEGFRVEASAVALRPRS